MAFGFMFAVRLLFVLTKLGYPTNESRAYYHVARALDVALPNTRSGEGKVDAKDCAMAVSSMMPNR